MTDVCPGVSISCNNVNTRDVSVMVATHHQYIDAALQLMSADHFESVCILYALTAAANDTISLTSLGVYADASSYAPLCAISVNPGTCRGKLWESTMCQ